MDKYKKGQSTLEYVILVTAVIVVILGLVGTKNSPFKDTLNKTLGGAVNQMDTMSTRWQDSVRGK